jgi:hypothetical protein
VYAAGRSGYNAVKMFNGQVYSGMTVGSSHEWNYDQALWKETKIEPDLWKIDYQATKRRARKAPKGSGVPVGAQYHWYIVAHQVSECCQFIFDEDITHRNFCFGAAVCGKDR